MMIAKVLSIDEEIERNLAIVSSVHDLLYDTQEVEQRKPSTRLVKLLADRGFEVLPMQGRRSTIKGNCEN